MGRFRMAPSKEELACEFYDPQSKPWLSYLKLWGTRGSVPVAGPQYSSYGGNTACLEIHHGGQVVIIDAGTGIRALGDRLVRSQTREIHLFFGHTHWDHIIGFPFFLPLYNPEFIVHIYAQERDEGNLKAALTRILRRDYFPIRLEEMKADIRFNEVNPEVPLTVGEIELSFMPCDHPGGALAFRINVGKRCIGYATDNEFLTGYRGHPAAITPDHELLAPYDKLIEFFDCCDPLIHEAQYTPRQYRSKVGWGHSSTSNATVLANLCNITHWYVTHHDPSASDAELSKRLQLHWQILADLEYDCNVTLASDGLTLPL